MLQIPYSPVHHNHLRPLRLILLLLRHPQWTPSNRHQGLQARLRPRASRVPALTVAPLNPRTFFLKESLRMNRSWTLVSSTTSSEENYIYRLTQRSSHHLGHKPPSLYKSNHRSLRGRIHLAYLQHPEERLPHVTVGGKRGFQLDSCVGLKYNEHPNPTILKTVDYADAVLDELIPGPDVVIQRGTFPEETLRARAQVAMEKEPAYGFTLAHLLTIICRKQYNARNQVTSAHDLERLRESPRYEWLWVVSVVRSDGKQGPVRWFPELEVRIPPEHWAALPVAGHKMLSPPSTPHRTAHLPQTPPSRPATAAAYSPYPSPRKPQPQRHSDRLHKRNNSAITSPTRPAPPNSVSDGNLLKASMTGHILVPLPEDINPCVRYPVYTQGGPGQRGVCLHNVYATTRSDRLLEHLRETILDADQPLILGEEVTHTIVERAFFPGESRGRAGRSIKERNDTGRWTLADILMRIILKQREWYWKDVRSAEVQSLIGGSNSPVWNWWAQRGMHEDLVWIVAVRQTLPDHQGQTRWIPELELRDR